MNEDKKLKREKKKDKKNKKSIDKKNKSSGIKQISVNPLPTFKELPKETILFDEKAESINKTEGNENSEDDETEPTDQSEIQMLDSLTGIPYTEDELLFAVPVVAPYTALTNYK